VVNFEISVLQVMPASSQVMQIFQWQFHGFILHFDLSAFSIMLQVYSLMTFTVNPKLCMALKVYSWLKCQVEFLPSKHITYNPEDQMNTLIQLKKYSISHFH
jgi:hypothetical protein